MIVINLKDWSERTRREELESQYDYMPKSVRDDFIAWKLKKESDDEG